MKIIVLQGSPNRGGSTGILVEEFSRGAKEAGHSVQRIDIADWDIKPCTGCVACGYEGPCIQKDDNNALKKLILEADVFATPLYYYGMSAQLKTVIDRFCSYNSSLTGKHMKSVLLAVAWNSDDWTFDSSDDKTHPFPSRGLCIGEEPAVMISL